ncbi:hypothetical protein TWF718_007755 [Orbilia javanica]|uniref:F-box domain-containing protein n=1 Tax=Orbilia javanica TaxID=47235 RepID=A0AAN8RH44_9PEZI
MPANLPIELQLQILEYADFTQLPILAQVCHAWHAYVTTSVFFPHRYTYYVLSEPEKPAHPNPHERRFLRPFFHKLLCYLTHFIRFEEEGQLVGCHVEFEQYDDYGRMDWSSLLRNVPVTSLDFRPYGNDITILPTFQTPPTDLKRLARCIPSEPEYLDIGHPSVLWKGYLEIVEVEGQEGEKGGEEEKGKTIHELFRIITERANRRYLPSPLNGSDPTMVVKTVPELDEYPQFSFPPALRLATMSGDMDFFGGGGRVSRIVKIVV